MPKCDLSEVASNSIEVALRHGCSPVNLLYIFRFLRRPLSGCFCPWLLKELLLVKKLTYHFGKFNKLIPTMKLLI